MHSQEISIKPYSEKYRNQILAIWEKSVLATHDFLSPTDFEEIKKLVSNINFNDFQVYCLTKEDLVLGFIGVADKKVEMLFLSPEHFGKAYGYKLLTFAIENLNANKLDVNEQNTKALKFYQKFGFEIFERTEKDEQGRDYPLLRMRYSK